MSYNCNLAHKDDFEGTPRNADRTGCLLACFNLLKESGHDLNLLNNVLTQLYLLRTESLNY